MSLANATASLDSLGPAARAIPVVGPEFDAIVNLLSKACEDADKVKWGKDDAVALVDQAVRSIATVVEKAKGMSDAEIADQTSSLQELQKLVEELDPNIKRLAALSYLSTWFYKNSDNKKEIDGLIQRFGHFADTFGVEANAVAPSDETEERKDEPAVEIKLDPERSKLLKSIYEIIGRTDEPTLTRDTSLNTLKKVLEYCEHHKGELLYVPDGTQDGAEGASQKRSTDMSEWDRAFIAVDQEMLFNIINAAHDIKIKPLLDVGCKTVANMIKGKTTEEIRRLFNIVNDFTPEEEAQIRKENEWAEGR